MRDMMISTDSRLEHSSQEACKDSVMGEDSRQTENDPNVLGHHPVRYRKTRNQHKHGEIVGPTVHT